MCHSRARARGSAVSSAGSGDRQRRQHRMRRGAEVGDRARPNRPGTRPAARRAGRRRSAAGSRRPAGRPAPPAATRRPAVRWWPARSPDQAGSEPVAPLRVSKTSRPVIACLSSGTVRITTDATKARVPSLPTTRCARMSHRAGVVQQRVQPVAHGVLHRELLLDRCRTEPGCPAPGRAAGPALRSSSGSSDRSRSSASAAPVSITVPLGSTSTSESSVL